MKYLGILGLSILLTPAAFAGPVTFDFEYENTDTGATATGSLTIDSGELATILSITGDSESPISDLEALSLTVSGASAGNGTFGLSDFQGFAWWSAGASFNFSQNLVGQPTNGNPWGTPDGQSGDFNFFNASGSPTAPDGQTYFTLYADGGGADAMQLVSLQEADPAPEPATFGLIGVGLGAMALWRRRTMRARG